MSAASSLPEASASQRHCRSQVQSDIIDEQQQQIDPQLEEVFTLQTNSALSQPRHVPLQASLAYLAGGQAHARSSSLAQHGGSQQEPTEPALQQQSPQEPACSSPRAEADGHGANDWGDCRYNGEEIDEDVLNALPPKLKHEVRLAIVGRLRPNQPAKARVGASTHPHASNQSQSLDRGLGKHGLSRSAAAQVLESEASSDLLP